MPTGYTQGILDGEIQTFKEFAIKCTRSFGATIHMREDDLDKELIPRTPSDYYLKEIERCKQTLEEARVVPDDELVSERKTEIEASIQSMLKSVDEKNFNKTKLEKMLLEAQRYEPPTEEHVGIKRFMIEQLSETIKHDCDIEYYESRIIELNLELQNISAEKIRKNMIESAQESLEYANKRYKEEIEGCKKANLWVKYFVESIK